MAESKNFNKIKAVIWNFISMLCLITLFSSPVYAGFTCNKTVKNLMADYLPSGVGEDLKCTLELANKLDSTADADISGDLDAISTNLDKCNPNNVSGQLNNITNAMKNPSFESLGVMGGLVDKYLNGAGQSGFDSKLRVLHAELGRRSDQETDPAKKAKYVERMNKISTLISKWPNIGAAADKAKGFLNGALDKSGEMKQVNKAKDLLDKANDIGDMSVTDLLKLLDSVDLGKFAKVKKKLDDICSLLPKGALKDKIKDVISEYLGGYLKQAKDYLKGLATKALEKAVGKLTGKAKEKAQDALDKLKDGAIGGALDKLKNTGVDGVVNSLGGLSGLAGGLGSGLGAVGGGFGGLGGGAGLGVGPGFGLLCNQPRLSEKVKCPTVECDANVALKGPISGSKEFIKRVEYYFEYEPPKDNRSVYLKENYQVNKAGEMTRPPGASFKPSTGGLLSGLNPLGSYASYAKACDKTVKDLLNKVPNIPGVKHLKCTFDLAGKLESTDEADISGDLDKISSTLDQCDPSKVSGQLNNLSNTLKNPSFASIGVMGGMIDKYLNGSGQAGFDSKLRSLHTALGKKQAQETDPVKKAQYTKRMNKINTLISKWPDIGAASNKAKDYLNNELDKSGVLDEVNKAKDLMDKANDIGNMSMTDLLGKLDKVNLGKLNGLKKKLDDICQLMPAGSLKDKLLGVLGAYVSGYLNQLKTYLKKKATDALNNGLDKLTGGALDDVNGVISGLQSLGGFKRGDVSEPDQDNRWRDMCLIGDVRLDADYELYKRQLMGDEEPMPGIAGSGPLYDKSSDKLHCVVPKNTERLSPLELDNGWRYRDMCPGNQKLRRVERDKLEDTLDIFRGEYGCLAPLPKCSLKNDWQLGAIQWKNKEYKQYINEFGNAISSGISTLLGSGGDLRQKLKSILSNSQFDAIKELMNPRKSAAAECKPAYWVRLMLDSCANQYILSKSMKPDYIFNPDGRKVGYSPRFCQPFKPILIDSSDEEYRVKDYVKRSYKGLLDQDYMPWIKYDRQEGKFNKEGKDYRKNNWPAQKIEWPAVAKIKLWTSRISSMLSKNPSINKYASHPVERIVDPLNPFSPRYDIAELVDGTQLIDRTLFGDATESKATLAVVAKAGGLKKYWCKPSKKQKKGYWQFGCTIYCSAVEVDLLRFRYKDYRLCMGCQIDTNEKAFWDEWEASRKYYKKKYCNRIKAKDDNDCEYGSVKDKEICGACGLYKKHAALAVTWGAVCAATAGAVGCDKAKENAKKAAKYIKNCQFCKTGAKAEALDRTRSRTNDKPKDAGKLDDWSPTNVGKNWPVCSTQFDHKGDKELCTKAKEKFGCDKQGEKSKDDPNIAKDSKKYAKQCEKKDIDDICGDAAKPVYSVNFLKIRTRKGDFRTDDTTPKLSDGITGALGSLSGGGGGIAGAAGSLGSSVGGHFDKKVEEWRKKYADEDPAPGYGFREYFGNHRPYMRWWDTGKEAFQVKNKPDYWCDWGANDAIMGVGRDYNSIHGRKAQLCRYGGGGGIGDSCFTMQDWKDGKNVPNGRKFPSLAGSEWAELKMYQANCFRKDGLNCLCQYEKVFKDGTGEDKVLSRMGTSLSVQVTTAEATQYNDKRQKSETVFWPLSWRGYSTTPANRDDAKTGPVIGKNQQFPYLYGDPSAGSMISGGLDAAQAGDVVIWPAGSNGLPHVGFVEATNNLKDYGSIARVPNQSRWVSISDADNGKYPDACGTTSYLGRGQPRTVYPNKDEMPESIQHFIEEQVTSTYYCDDAELGHCVERKWNTISIWRPYEDKVRDVK